MPGGQEDIHSLGEPRKKMAKDITEAGRSGMCKGGASGEKGGRNGSVKSEDPWPKEKVPPPEKQFRTERRLRGGAGAQSMAQ